MDKKQMLISIGIVLIGGVLAAGIVMSPFFLRPNADESLQWATARTTLSAITIPIVLGGFYFSTIQFRKTMSKPQIKVAFNENGNQQATIIIKDGQLQYWPRVWLINKGNAVARYFQIDFFIPEYIGKYDHSLLYYEPHFEIISFNPKPNENYIMAYLNEGTPVFWVNRPSQPSKMFLVAALDQNKILCFSGDYFEIAYRVYGDWAETQEGKLRVNIEKKETTRTPATS
jgi:hypothetical protein